MVLHLVNLTSAGTWRAPVEELIPVGPVRVRIQLPKVSAARTAQLLVAGISRQVSMNQGIVSLEIAKIVDHEVIVVPIGKASPSR